MSSIIVLDSSDEDETPPIKTEAGNVSGNSNTPILKNQHGKQRSIPSGLTITPRLSPTTMGITKGISSAIGGGSVPSSSFQAFNNAISNERLTPTPPKVQVGSSNPRKRKTPTPPHSQLQTMPRLTAKNFANLTNSSPAKAATTLAPLPPIMPMITGVHSMAAGATPPLQLMATPPHNMAGYMGLNEQLMINPHLLPTNLPPNTTITAHGQNPNQNNINNNFKIHLPFNKPNTTPSPAASPASSVPKPPSPHLAPSPQPARTDKNSKRIKPTTLLKSSDESWQKHKTQSQKGSINLGSDVVLEMLPPAATESPKSISASSSRHHTPMTSPTTPKSRKSPDVIMITPDDHSPKTYKNNDTVLDLTHSPAKVTTTRTATPTKATEIVDLVNTPDHKKQHINGISAKQSKITETKVEKPSPPPPPPKPPLDPEYEELIKVCRQADPSSDMEKLIKSKLIKYYYEVHNDFVKSKSFRRSIRKVVDSIKAKPDLVYYNLKTIVEELKVRRKARRVEEAAATTAPTNNHKEANTSQEAPASDKVKTEDIQQANTTNSSSTTTAATTLSSATKEFGISATATTSTGNKKLDEQIKKLNKALYVLTKRIEVLEQTEVDWDDDDSSFLQVERFKKRACQIYEKICDLTGESKNAHRLVKKPIKFNETRIPQFNKTLQAFINRTKEFPDYYDVLRMLEHCNRTYNLGLVNFEIKNIAEDAFIKVGKLLQARRKADLYETVTHYAGDGLDPAKADPALAAKLNENLKNHKKINDILEKFARKQDMPEEEEEEIKAEKTVNTMEDTTETSPLNSETRSNKIKPITCSEDKDEKENLVKPEENEQEIEKAKRGTQNDEAVEDYEDDEDDEDDDEEDDDNLDEQVETLANSAVLDNESDTEIISPKGNEREEEDVEEESAEGIQNKTNAATEYNVVLKNSTDNLTHDTREIEKENYTENNATIPKISSETNDGEYVINNNVCKPAIETTKTVIDTPSPTIINKDKSLIPSSSPPPMLLAPLATIPNGKLRDSPTHQVLNSNSSSSLTVSKAIRHTDLNASIINNASVTATTTTTADLKIVHVSSLEPDDDIIMSERCTSLNTRNEDAASLCAERSSVPSSASKSLEEIVISDEES